MGISGRPPRLAEQSRRLKPARTGGYPSGQRGQTVNLVAMPSQVRILLHPCRVPIGMDRIRRPGDLVSEPTESKVRSITEGNDEDRSADIRPRRPETETNGSSGLCDLRWIFPGAGSDAGETAGVTQW